MNLEERLEEMEQRIARLEDERAIRALKARYLRACDLKLPDDVRDTLLPDVTIDYQGFPPIHDRESFVGIYAELGCLPEIFDIHHAGNGIITFEDTARATGTWTLTYHNINLKERTLTRFGVQYDDLYLKRDGRWWIARSKSWQTYAFVEQVGENGARTILAMGKGPESFADKKG